MKKLVLSLLFILLVFISTVSFAQEMAPMDPMQIEINNGVVYPFFKALKQGDVNAIKQYLSSDMYSTYQKLLEENKDYPKFLRNYYQGAKFRVEKIQKFDEYVVVDVVIEFPNGSQSKNSFRLLKENDVLQSKNKSNRWKISEMPYKRDRHHFEKDFTAE